ncbi:MAG: DUF3048 domain-containing protein [Clostridia bacterium]|nr:DUF3048 domain-containing protein [Clostridia bacterium]
MKKRIIAISAIAGVIVVVAIAACLVMFTGEKVPVTTEPVTTTEPTTIPEDTSHVNKLTGIENLSDGAVGKRPVAIMINNLKGSLPQYGIYGADIMFEMPVEGGITRMMALFGDYTKIPNVCSVRSCRYYFPIFAHGYDAIYFCFGINESLARPTVEKLGIDMFNATDSFDPKLFARDPERLKRYSREHTAYVKGQSIPSVLKEYKTRTDILEEKNKNFFNFREEGVSKKAGNISCLDVRLDFSKLYYSTFTYDKEKKVYYKTHCGKPHMDSKENKQLNYKNVFVLETEIKPHTDNYLVKIDWKGGTGYYISNGGAQKITWTKKSESSPIKFYNENGKQIKVNTGNSYIGILAPNLTTIKGAEAAAK